MKAIKTSEQNANSNRANIVRPALLVIGFVGLMSIVGMAHAGVISTSLPDLGWLDWSQAFSDGASSGFDAAGAML